MEAPRKIDRCKKLRWIFGVGKTLFVDCCRCLKPPRTQRTLEYRKKNAIENITVFFSCPLRKISSKSKSLGFFLFTMSMLFAREVCTFFSTNHPLIAAGQACVPWRTTCSSAAARVATAKRPNVSPSIGLPTRKRCVPRWMDMQSGTPTATSKLG